MLANTNGIMKTNRRFSVGETVVLTEDWLPPRNPKLKFNSGTQGEVEALHEDGKRILMCMKFPHSPAMSEVIPTSILRRA